MQLIVVTWTEIMDVLDTALERGRSGRLGERRHPQFEDFVRRHAKNAEGSRTWSGGASGSRDSSEL